MCIISNSYFSELFQLIIKDPDRKNKNPLVEVFKRNHLICTLSYQQIQSNLSFESLTNPF